MHLRTKRRIIQFNIHVSKPEIIKPLDYFTFLKFLAGAESESILEKAMFMINKRRE